MTDTVFARARRLEPRAYWAIIAGLLALMVASLLLMGRTSICACGTIKLWHGLVHSSENSQHVFDWYSFTHVLHGFFLYFIAWWFLPRWPVLARLVVALALEGAWEVLENTPFIIERYRAGTISLNYYGDSVINSLFDVVSMMIGFALARRFPVWGSVATVAVIEVGLILLIKDNLFLNVLMLMYPIEAVRAWQGGP